MSDAPVGAVTTEPILLHATVSDALYRAALDGWRRTHAEGAVVTAELRLAENRDKITCLRHVVRVQRASKLHAAVRRWCSAAAALTCAASLRSERAKIKELEAQLELEREASRDMSTKLKLMQNREESDLAAVAAMQSNGGEGEDGGTGGLDSRMEGDGSDLESRWTGAQSDVRARLAPPTAAAPPRKAATPTSQRQPQQQQVPHNVPAISPGGASLPPPRPLGSRAEQLLSAWRREARGVTVG